MKSCGEEEIQIKAIYADAMVKLHNIAILSTICAYVHAVLML